MSRHYFSVFESIPAEFPSDFPLEESVERLKRLVKPLPSVLRRLFAFGMIMNPSPSNLGGIFQQIAAGEAAAVGKVTEGRVAICREVPFVRNESKPYFMGAFKEGCNRVMLIGAFVLPLHKRVEMTIYLGFLLFCFAWMVIGGAPWISLLAPLGMYVFILGLFAWCKWSARNDQAWLSDLIRKALEKEKLPSENRGDCGPTPDQVQLS